VLACQTNQAREGHPTVPTGKKGFDGFEATPEQTRRTRQAAGGDWSIGTPILRDARRAAWTPTALSGGGSRLAQFIRTSREVGEGRERKRTRRQLPARESLLAQVQRRPVRLATGRSSRRHGCGARRRSAAPGPSATLTRSGARPRDLAVVADCRAAQRTSPRSFVTSRTVSRDAAGRCAVDLDVEAHADRPSP
jgi:hypothetical protein